MIISFIDLLKIRIQIIEVELISLNARFEVMQRKIAWVVERSLLAAQILALEEELAVSQSSLSHEQ